MHTLLLTLVLSGSQLTASPPSSPNGEVLKTLDLGVGSTLGIGTGIKLRAGADLGPLFVALDGDVGYILFGATFTGHLVVGWNFEPGNDVLRPYLRAGFGVAVGIPPGSSTGVGVLPLVPLDLGIEWKPTPWVGLGLEGGVAIETNDMSHVGVYPQGRISAMFYL